jgi:hypothetical protein
MKRACKSFTPTNSKWLLQIQKNDHMTYRLIYIIFASFLLACLSKSEPKPRREYFVRPVEFVCGYTFNDTTKWVIACRVWGLLKYYHPIPDIEVCPTMNDILESRDEIFDIVVSHINSNPIT